MAITFTSESELEQNLINQLISGESQWTYRKDLNTEEKLWLIIKDLPTNKKSKHKKTHKSLVLWV